MEAVNEWQTANLDMFRALINELIPDIQETIKWSVPVFLHKGKLVCAMSTFKNHTKYNFFRGSELDDIHNIFNSGLDSKHHRSINLTDGTTINRQHLSDLILQAAALS